jgi:serine/threonine-protein kinase
MMIRTVASIVILFFCAVAVHAESFQVYSNPRFGATAEVPSDWRADPPPENGDGLVFRSPDGQASITISGVLNIADSVAEAMKTEEQPSEGETITYHQHGRRMVVVSGLRGDKIFYRKSLLVCRDQIWNHLWLEYPVAQKAEYDALVARIARSLHFSGVSAQIPNCR